jgi:predicted porin
MKKNLIAAAALAAATIPSAYAVDMKAGDWTVSLGGNINAFYTSSDCKNPTGTVTGLALGDNGFACGGAANQKSTVIGNGLLPSQLSAGARSTQGGYDISANITISVATATGSSLAQNATVDIRNAFMTIGNKDIGTFKLGRDYGLFGLHAVLNDMTLLGVGAATAATQNGRVSLGHLGSGMLYAQHYGQMVYSTPSTGGFSADIGVFSPVGTTLGQGQLAKDSPQFQGRLNFGSGAFKGWVTAKSQSFASGGVGSPAFNMNGTEIGGSFSSGGFGLVANYQEGKGLGILSDGDQGNIKSQHTFVQGTYQVNAKTKLGLGWGKSENKDRPTAGILNTGTASDLKSNENVTGAVYYNITPQVTLVGELGETKSKAFNGATAKQNSIAFGAIFFF